MTGPSLELPRQPGFVLLLAFSLVLFLVPAAVVLAGPLKSNGSPAVMLALLAAALLMLGGLTGRLPSSVRSAGTIFLFVALALQGISWAKGQILLTDSVTSASTVRALIVLVDSTAIALLAMSAARSWHHRMWVRTTLVAGLIYNAVVGIFQATFSIDERYRLKPPGFVLNRDFTSRERDGVFRATGTSDSPIEYSVCATCLLALSITLLSRRHHIAVRVMGAVGVLVAPVALLDSLSRTGAVTLAGASLAYLATLPLPAALAGLLALITLTGFAFVVNPSRFQDIINLFVNARTDDSITGRTSDYAVVSRSFREHPWVGVGLGTLVQSRSRYLDNQWLQTALQGGLAGITATALQFGAGFIAVLSPGRFVDRIERSGYLALLTAILASSFTFDLYGFNQARFTFFVVIGLAWSAYAEARQRSAAMPDRQGLEAACG